MKRTDTRHQEISDADPEATVHPLQAVDHSPRDLSDDLIDASDGDHLAAARVEVAAARRVEADAQGLLVTARAKHTDMLENPKTPRHRVIEAAEQAAAAERAYQTRVAERVAVERQLLRAQESGTELAPDGRLLRFGSVEEFVIDFVLPVWGHDRSNREIRWCLQWWEHPGAQVRLETLWAAFEQMRLEPAPAMDVWFRDHLVPAMDWLTRESGPFHGCSQTLHKDPEVWSVSCAPGGYFENFPSETDQLREAAARGA